MNLSKFEIANTQLGKALIATSRIDAGFVILKMSGKILRNSYDIFSAPFDSHLVQIEYGTYYDPDSPGRFINHSCNPNAILAGSLLVSIKDINIDEEITFDYSTVMDENNYTLDCLCGNENCRNIIRDFITLPRELRQKYIDLGGVQHFILMKCSSRI